MSTLQLSAANVPSVSAQTDATSKICDEEDPTAIRQGRVVTSP